MPRSKEKSSGTSTPDTRPSRSLRRRAALPVVGGLATALAIVGIATAPKTADHSKHANRSPEVSKSDYEKALVKELKTAYEGPLALRSAKDTGETRSDIDATGAERAVVQVSIDGTAINHKTADNRSTPPYYYVGLMEQVYSAEDPSFGMQGSVSGIDDEGNAEIYPRLDNFTGSTPATYRYVLGVGAAEFSTREGNDEIAAIYNLGEVDITGSNGRITSIEVVPPEGGEAKPQIVTPTPTQPLQEFLR